LLVFETVRFKNFLSTGNDFTEITLSSHDTTLIVGGNGHGKSTFMDAVCFALYNKSFRKISKPQLINSINNRNCLVEVEFSSGKDSYLIRRGMRPNVFEIVKNGELINQEASNRDYQEILEKYILKLTFKSFCQVVILGSASFVPFMQLPTGQRREIIEDLLDIQIFTTMNMLLKEKVNANERALLDVDYRLDLTAEKLRMQEEHVRSMLSSSQEMIDSLGEKVEKYRDEIASEERLIAEKRVEQAALIDQTAGHEDLSRTIASMASISSKLTDRAEKLGHDISFFHDNDTCPTCRQAIDEEFRSSTVSSKGKEREEVETALSELTRRREEADARLTSVRRALDRIARSKISGLESSIADLQEQIAKVEERNVAYVADSGSIRLLEEERDVVAAEKKSLIEEREVHRVVGRILKDDGIKSKIIKQYIPIINKLINKYLAAMDFFVQFEIDENFSETIKSRFRDVFTYASFSEGEKTRIDLALLFAWRTIAKLRNSASTNLLILDEVFDGSLDSTGSDDFLNILYSVAGESNIFVISHKTDQMKDKFDRVIEFEKRNNFSRISGGES
jgi:DNA repair exonuclease SbcCD ATPase subunit